MIRNNAERKPKALWTDNNSGEKIKYYEATTERDEAEYVIRQILKKNKKAIKPRYSRVISNKCSITCT